MASIDWKRKLTSRKLWAAVAGVESVKPCPQRAARQRGGRKDRTSP